MECRTGDKTVGSDSEVIAVLKSTCTQCNHRQEGKITEGRYMERGGASIGIRRQGFSGGGLVPVGD